MMGETAELQFLGAAGTVTGSKYLFQYENKKILVDCGLFQGLKSLRLKNWQTLPVRASDIDAVILTHAHIDHSGYLPRLVKDGFRGKIYCTDATKEVCRILLPDCGYLLEEEAGYLNKHGRSKHKPALPLFTFDEAIESLNYLVALPLKTEQKLSENLSFHFRYAGHILGAASVILSFGHRRIAFTGDVGRQSDDIFFPPEPLPPVDYLVTESTYGNLLHSAVSPREEIARVINETVAKKGKIIVPAFAVGRAQSILYHISQLKKQKQIPDIPVYLNSPMATDFQHLMTRFPTWHKLSKQECEEMDSGIRFVKTPEESKRLNETDGSMVIISASGMLTGGRILHHLKAFAPHPENSILLTGFQTQGTRGAALERGASEIKIHGEFVPVRAKVSSLENISAHADYSEMVRWFTQSKIQPRKVFITHGEALAADDFRHHLAELFKWDCTVPDHNETVKLDL